MRGLVPIIQKGTKKKNRLGQEYCATWSAVNPRIHAWQVMLLLWSQYGDIFRNSGGVARIKLCFVFCDVYDIQQLYYISVRQSK